MLTTASVPQESANTIEDLEHLKITAFKDGTADNIPDGNGTVRGASNVVHLDAYRDRRLAGAFEATGAGTAAFGSSTTGDHPLTVFQDSSIPRQEWKQPSSPEFIRITRAIFVKSILQSLDTIQPFAQTPDAALYIHQILHQIQELEATSPDDPFLEVLSGFYVALAYNHLWADYDAGQFAAVRKILKKFADRPSLQLKEIEKAIMEMEEIGFNTTPIPISPEDFDE